MERTAIHVARLEAIHMTDNRDSVFKEIGKPPDVWDWAPELLLRIS
jgi:hypothetical protein